MLPQAVKERRDIRHQPVLPCGEQDSNCSHDRNPSCCSNRSPAPLVDQKHRFERCGEPYRFAFSQPEGCDQGAGQGRVGFPSEQASVEAAFDGDSCRLVGTRETSRVCIVSG